MKHLQHNEYANRPAFGYICFNELRTRRLAPSRAKKQFLHAKAIKVPYFQIFTKRRESLSARFYCSLLCPHRSLDIVSIVAFPFTTSDATFLLKIYIDRKSFPRVSLHERHSPIRSRLLLPSFYVCVKGSSAKLKLSQLIRMQPTSLLRRACPERLGHPTIHRSDESFVSRRITTMMTTTTRTTR